MTPHERAATVVSELRALFGHQFAPGDEAFAAHAITTALQAQSNADEERHREKQQALRTLIAEQAKRADAAEAKVKLLLQLRDEFIVKAIESWRKEAESAIAERDALAAHNAKLREALERHHRWQQEQTEEDQYGIVLAEAYLCSLLCEDTISALSTTPAESLEETRRAAKIEALEGIPCRMNGIVPPSCNDLDLVGKCLRCAALAELKGGRG